MSSPRVGIGSRNGAARAALVRAATRLLVRRGYHGSSVVELARAADVSKNQFFHYFPGKEALALAALREALDGLRADAATGAALRPDSPGLALIAALGLQRDGLPPLLAAEAGEALAELSEAQGGRGALERALGRAALAAVESV